MAEKKPRIFQDSRDMVMSLLVIVVIMALVVTFTGMCSLRKDPVENGPVREVDAQSFLDLQARAVTFPVRLPESPGGWVANSARRHPVNNTPAPLIGWVTADRGYLQLLQTDQPAEDAVEQIDVHPREVNGTREVDGREFTVWTPFEDTADTVWTATLSDVTLVFAGTADEGEFRQLIHNTLVAEPIRN
ncbi:DUF4245 domain-containing protein [Corynebacterium sp. TAE3-ERU16]|uniref:DUF4245 domain-containing protein n=1 Tax=Corynebacterium sp. TAE3-ERU16 TaxID=2849493 RepID=UPI001C47A390|nr:DUF4245 domain-containing protein [Corynebacterium sp. TAE3-ERU16]